MFIPPYRITLSGGGMKGFAHIGALEVLNERGYLGAVKEYVGISAGALCAFMLCIGCTLAEMHLTVQLLDLSTVRDLEPETILEFSERFGLDGGTNLEKLLTAILRAKKLPPTLTFRELADRRLGPKLRIYATDLHACMPCHFSLETTPDTEVRTAARASMSIPLYFTPVEDPSTGHLLVDGGVVTHNPFELLTREEREVSLSIAFADGHKPKEEIQGLVDYVVQLYHSLEYYGTRQLEKDWAHRILYIPCGSVNTMHFEMSMEERLQILETGRKGAEAFLDAWAARGPKAGKKPPRRFSCS